MAQQKQDCRDFQGFSVHMDTHPENYILNLNHNLDQAKPCDNYRHVVILEGST